MSATREDIKLIATKFFRWWWNQPGANTDDGFEEWASTEGASLLAAALSTEPGEAEKKRAPVDYYKVLKRFAEEDGSIREGRLTALSFALAAGQLDKLYAPPDLYSEDLW